MPCDTLVLVRPTSLFAVATLAGLLACGDATSGNPWTSTGVTTNVTTPGSTSSSSGPGEDSTGTSTSTSTSTSTGADTTLPPPPDMPNFETIGPTPEGCEKIDLLFAIDTNGSGLPNQQDYMREVAEKMATRMLGLADAIVAEAANYDLHLMVTTVGPDFTTTADELCGVDCDPITMPCDLVPEHVCMESWEECDWTLGSGMIFPRGVGASNKLCPTTEGRRFTRSQDPQFKEAIDCLLHTGRSGTKQGYSAITPMAALKPEMVAADGCNAGFLREDAMLVVVIVSVNEGVSAGTPEEWVQDLLAIKGGYEDGVVLSVLASGIPSEGGGCSDYSSKIRAFGELMPHHVLGCISAPDYTPFITAAIDKIDAVCDQFIPPG